MSEKPMKLKDFVSESLIQIVEGVVEAQHAMEGKNAFIHPSGIFSHHRDTNTLVTDLSERDRKFIQNIEFDVAVTAIEGDETKGGIGVVAAVLNAGVQHTMDNQVSTISRIKFTVPIILPEQ